MENKLTKNSIRNLRYKILGITVFVILSLVVVFFLSFLLLLINFDNDKACSIDGGIWNPEMSRCEDKFGNKWKF